MTRRRPKKRQPTHRPHSEQRTKPTVKVPERRERTEHLPAAEPADGTRWSKTRHGAAAGRGFHYQEAVAAFYAAGLLVSNDHSLIVPEGSHEDIHCQGPSPLAVQAKSRQFRMGDFPAADVARHLRDLHLRRVDFPFDGTTMLAIDRDVREAPLPTSELAVGDLPSAHPLARACERVRQGQGWAPGSLDDIVLCFMTAGRAKDRATALVADFFGVEPAVAERITLEYRQLVCDAADLNAERPHTDPKFIDRTTVQRVAERFISECDPSSLTAAIASGACEPADLDTPTPDDNFFKGVHAQPGHIAAGLPTERPELVQAIVAGLSSTGSVLLTGPSGVGKSTTMWMAAYMTRNVSWYRVRRLTAADVEDIHRLAVGRRPTESAPVGFLIDGVGLGDTDGWDDLVRRFAGTPHVYLLGSARVEDTFGVTTLTEIVRIEVSLDESVAQRIYLNLRDAGLTALSHWCEALIDANNLTLEYTYLLTQGQRLANVLGSQVRRLQGAPETDAEVQLLALASTGHAYGLELPIDLAGRALALSDPDLRRAVSRLKDEHLVLEASGRLVTLHLMRSKTLSRLVHLNPPPTMLTTAKRLIQNVAAIDVARLIVGLLRDRVDLDAELIAAAAERATTDDPRTGLLASVMHAVRSADFIRHARQWAGVIREEEVPPAQWPITVNLSLLTSDQVPGMHPAIAAAVARLRAMGDQPTPLWDQLVGHLTPQRIVQAVAEQDTAAGIAALLSACRGGTSDLVEALEDQDWATTTAAECLSTCSAEEFAYVCSVAQDVSNGLAGSLVDAAGGEGHVIARIRERYPTTYVVGRAADGEEDAQVAKARLVYIDDELTPNPDGTARDVARMLLRSLPGCSKADVETTRAGGKPHSHGDLVFGSSGMLHEYSLTEYATDWNRARSVLVLHELGFASPGEHTSQVAALLPRAVDYLHRLLTLWVTQRDRYFEWDWEWATQERTRLALLIDELTVPQDGVRLMQQAIPATGDRLRRLLNPGLDGPPGEPEQLTALQSDNAHTVLSAVVYTVSNHLMNKQLRQLAFFARSTAKHLRGMIVDEKWELAGLEGAPGGAQELAAMLYELADISAAIANQVLTERELRQHSRAGPRPSAVTRSAELARSASLGRIRSLLKDFEATVTEHGVKAQVLTKDADPDEGYWPHIDIAVVVTCSDLQEWAQAQQVVATALLDLRADLHLPPTLVCPEIDGRRERSMAFEVQSQVFPLSARYPEWFDDDGESMPLTATLPAAVERASLALVRRSGLQYFQSLNSVMGALQSAYDETEAMFDAAVEQVRSHGDDDVIDAIVEELSRLAGAVNMELLDDGAPGDVARQVLDSLEGGAQTPLVDTLLGIKFFAVQWTHDPSVASALLHAAPTE